MTKRGEPINRRKALARLGLAVGAIYCAPDVIGLSRAAYAGGGSSPTAPSAPDPPSSPTAPSGSSNPASPQSERNSEQRSGCSQPDTLERASISRRDMERARAAVARGEAKPLREILEIVQKQNPGRLIKVGFSNASGSPSYWLRMVSANGLVQMVRVEAGSGRITSVEGC